MEATDRRPSERDEQRVLTSREELVERLGQSVPADGSVEPLAGLRLIRHSAPTLRKGRSAFAAFIAAEGKQWQWHIGNYP